MNLIKHYWISRNGIVPSEKYLVRFRNKSAGVEESSPSGQYSTGWTLTALIYTGCTRPAFCRLRVATAANTADTPL